MAYATDIIQLSFEKTKALFFPIDKKYWMKLGFVNMLGANQAGSSSSGNYGGDDYPGLTRANIAAFNSKALEFFTSYGVFFGIGIFIIYLLSLATSYLSSIFCFVFIEGLMNKKFEIKKSMGQVKRQANSLFFVRFILGLVSLLVLGIIFYPIIDSFFRNDLVNFNLWLFIPMFIWLFIFAVVIGIFIFILYDFLIPLMYLKKCGFFESWLIFKKIAKNQKMEIFIYFLIKILLSLASGVIALLVLLVLAIPLILSILLFVGLGILMFIGLKMINDFLAIGVTAIYATAIFLFLIYLLNVIFVPMPAFFRIYSLEMVKKLDNKK